MCDLLHTNTPFVVATVGLDLHLSARSAAPLFWSLFAGKSDLSFCSCASASELHPLMSSSQSQPGLPFSIAADLQPCRLLELPPDLLEYITSSAAPALHFKAKDASHPDAFLCSDSKSYHVRQVHTSNTVYLTTPSSDASTTVAVSQCASALEALPAPANHAKHILHSLLTPVGEPQDLEIPPVEARSKHHVFAYTPMSNVECQTAWTDVAAFEHSGHSFRPTAAALTKVWKWLMEIAYAHGVNLASSPLQKESIDKMLDGEDEWPRELVDAILLKLTDGAQESLALHQETTIKWVGHIMLEARHQNPVEQSKMDKAQFVNAWKDALPEAWRNHATLDVLKVCSHLHAT